MNRRRWSSTDVNHHLYADHDQAQQIELVKREIRDGARAVILAPVKPEEAVKELEAMNPAVRSSSLDTPSPAAGWRIPSVWTARDWKDAGRPLYPRPKDVPVYLFCKGLDYGDGALVYEGSVACWRNMGMITVIEKKNQDTYIGRLSRKQIPPAAARSPS